MTNVKMKANDQLHISSVQADSLQPDEQFEVSEEEAKRLERAGLAKRVGSAKAEKAAPANKAEKAAPRNKGIISAASMAPAKRSTLKTKGK